MDQDSLLSRRLLYDGRSPGFLQFYPICFNFRGLHLLYQARPTGYIERLFLGRYWGGDCIDLKHKADWIGLTIIILSLHPRQYFTIMAILLPHSFDPILQCFPFYPVPCLHLMTSKALQHFESRKDDKFSISMQHLMMVMCNCNDRQLLHMYREEAN